MLITAKPQSVSAEDRALESFLGVSFKDKNAFASLREQLKEKKYPRQQLVSILSDYNRSIGNDDPAVMHNIQRLLSEELPCVVTGQQLGFMGGPAYTILKAITCLKVAQQTNAVPIFWLATEDHDVAEIDHTYLIDALGNLQRFYLSFPKDGYSVEDLKLSSRHEEEIKRFYEAVNVPEEERAKISSSYATTMASILAKQFAGTGLVFLEPKLLRPLAKSFFHKEIEQHLQIQEILTKTSEKLAKEGGATPLPFGQGTHLFLKSDSGVREKLHANGDVFTAGKQSYTLAECLALSESSPERFSPSAAARPILQSALLPVLAYVAGPSEVAYYRQLGDYHHFHSVPMPCIISRIHATLIPPQATILLEKCGLEPWEEIPQHWSELMPSLNAEVEAVQDGWFRVAARSFGADLEEQVLMRVVKQATRKMQRKVTKARLKRQGLPSHGLHFLRNLIHPHGKPQERVLNWWGFQAESSENLIQKFIEIPDEGSETHFYSYLS